MARAKAGVGFSYWWGPRPLAPRGPDQQHQGLMLRWLPELLAQRQLRRRLLRLRRQDLGGAGEQRRPDQRLAPLQHRRLPQRHQPLEDRVEGQPEDGRRHGVPQRRLRAHLPLREGRRLGLDVRLRVQGLRGRAASRASAPRPPRTTASVAPASSGRGRQRRPLDWRRTSPHCLTPAPSPHAERGFRLPQRAWKRPRPAERSAGDAHSNARASGVGGSRQGRDALASTDVRQSSRRVSLGPALALGGALTAAALGGCIVDPNGPKRGEGDDGNELPPGTEPASLLPGGVRRLTNAEYDATVHGLTGTALTPSDGFAPDARQQGLHRQPGARSSTACMPSSSWHRPPRSPPRCVRAPTSWRHAPTRRAWPRRARVPSSSPSAATPIAARSRPSRSTRCSPCTLWAPRAPATPRGSSRWRARSCSRRACSTPPRSAMGTAAATPSRSPIPSWPPRWP